MRSSPRSAISRRSAATIGLGEASASLGAACMTDSRHSLDDPRDLGLGIGAEGITGLFGRGLLGTRPPARQAPGGRPVEEQGASKEAIDRRLDFGAQAGDDLPGALRLAAALFEQFEVVADRLLARDGRERAENGPEKADRLVLSAGEGVEAVGARVDIDETPIDLALCRARGQGGDGGGKGRVDQHRTVDQRYVGLVAVAHVHRHDAFEEGAAGGPVAAATSGQCVDFAELQRRKRAREARRGAAGECQFEQVGKVLPARQWRPRAELDWQAVLAFFHHRRAVHVQRFEEAAEIRRRHHQIERVVRRQKRRPRAAFGHGLQRVVNEAREAGAGERRLEPAPAHEVRNLAPHFGLRFRARRSRETALPGRLSTHSTSGCAQYLANFHPGRAAGSSSASTSADLSHRSVSGSRLCPNESPGRGTPR